MSPEQLREMLEQVRSGKLSTDSALEQLRTLPYEDLGYAKLDHHRTLRSGYPEVIYCAGKTATQIREIAERLTGHGRPVLATRLAPEVWEQISADLPSANYNLTARVFVMPPDEATAARMAAEADGRGTILVATGGTTDIPVAEEAAITAETMGNRVLRLYDVGVAGLHRLLDHQAELQSASVVIAVAGMEGALASVIGGLVSAPVIAVPTSIGYGASFGGLAALLSMLNSCAPGVAVVNIDNGFGAGYMAGVINAK